MTTSYPLSWPPGFPRTPRGAREKGRFSSSYDSALSNVVRSLKLFGTDSRRPVKDPVLSTNRDMLGHVKDDDPGVAVWFVWDGIQVCIPVDRYQTAAANLQAIHHIIEARRVELRHGTLALVRATFEGFKSLPAPKHWSEVLGIARSATLDQVREAYRERARRAHPDAGGSQAAMAELNAARDAAIGEIQA